MMIGDKTLFAIECEILEEINQQIFGQFRFWAKEQPIGRWDDEQVYLLGCVNWLYDFVEKPQNRFEPELENKSKEEIFFLLFDSFMPAATQEKVKPLFENIESRFHISYLGFSAFIDFLDILLIETPYQQRLFWRDIEDMVQHEAVLPPNTMQKVAIEFYLWFAKEVPSYSFPTHQDLEEYNLGMAAVKRKDYRNALDHFKKSLEIRIHDKTHQRIAEVLRFLQQPEEAESHIMAAFKLNPYHSQIATLYAELLIKHGANEEASTILDNVLKKNSTYGPAKRLKNLLTL